MSYCRIKTPLNRRKAYRVYKARGKSCAKAKAKRLGAEIKRSHEDGALLDSLIVENHSIEQKYSLTWTGIDQPMQMRRTSRAADKEPQVNNKCIWQMLILIRFSLLLASVLASKFSFRLHRPVHANVSGSAVRIRRCISRNSTTLPLATLNGDRRWKKNSALSFLNKATSTRSLPSSVRRRRASSTRTSWMPRCAWMCMRTLHSRIHNRCAWTNNIWM